MKVVDPSVEGNQILNVTFKVSKLRGNECACPFSHIIAMPLFPA